MLSILSVGVGKQLDTSRVARYSVAHFLRPFHRSVVMGSTAQQQMLERLKDDIARSVRKGRSEAEIVTELTNRGLDHARAEALVREVAYTVRRPGTDDARAAAVFKRIRQRHIDTIGIGAMALVIGIVLSVATSALLEGTGFSVLFKGMIVAGLVAMGSGIVGLIQHSND
jgi:hypothetical protein